MLFRSCQLVGCTCTHVTNGFNVSAGEPLGNDGDRCWLVLFCLSQLVTGRMQSAADPYTTNGKIEVLLMKVL